jgi:hypothetical protein
MKTKQQLILELTCLERRLLKLQEELGKQRFLITVDDVSASLYYLKNGKERLLKSKSNY